MKLYPNHTEIKKGEKMPPMFFRQYQGIAESTDGKKYQFTTNISGGHPILESKQTGRTVTIGWQEIIEIAIAAGIDSRDPIDSEGVNIELKIRSPEGRQDNVPVRRRRERTKSSIKSKR